MLDLVTAWCGPKCVMNSVCPVLGTFVIASVTAVAVTYCICETIVGWDVDHVEQHGKSPPPH